MAQSVARGRAQGGTVRMARPVRAPQGWAAACLTVAALCATSGPVARAAALSQEPAKIILVNGRIHTPLGTQEAMAIGARGLILGVGTTTEVERLRAKATQTVDLQGRAVLPGFSDMHVHPVFAGLQAQRCVVPQGSSLEALQRAVKQCAAKAAPGEWITGGQWDASALERTPTRDLLDAVAPDNPVLLGDTSEHSAWANSRALQIAGIDRKTPNPSLGILERDAAGEPTGVLREEAVALVRKHVPAPTDAQIRAALKSSADLMLSEGITSFTEAAAGYSSTVEREVSAYAALADSGALKQRIRLCLSWTPGNTDSEAVIAARNFYARERIAVDCVKIFLDGVPTDSHTAAMLEPYAGKVAGRTDEASRRGLLLLPQKVIDEAVTRFDSVGLAVKFHAAGDAAVRAGLNAIEAARRKNGFSGVLHDVGHCTFVAREDLSRARAIGATFEVSPYLWDPSPINDDITAAVGTDRIRRVWPVREMIDAGALVVPGSDWSVVPSVNPWIAVETLVTRENPGGSARSFGKEEAITVKEAIDLFTVNAARHRHLEGSVGSIAPGMLADLIVLSKDPYEVPARELHEVTVLATFIAGESVFQRP
jgi:predicted amidohydrolase YtcJ